MIFVIDLERGGLHDLGKKSWQRIWKKFWFKGAQGVLIDLGV